jgi:putative endonuclease
MPGPDAAVPAWYVYILECADGTLYTGIATDMERRLRQHNGVLTGGPRYTRGRRPVQLLWSEAVRDRGVALRREAEIKKLDRTAKLRLIGG